MSDSIGIAATVIKALKMRGLSVRELSEKIGMSNPGVYKALNKDDFKVSTLQKIADVLKVDICDLIKGAEFSGINIEEGFVTRIELSEKLTKLEKEIESLHDWCKNNR